MSRDDLVRIAPLAEGRALPLVVAPAGEGLDVAGWAAEQRETIDGWVLEHGGVLLRGFGLSSVDDFETVLAPIAGELLDYQERSSPRSAVAKQVYTSTDYPPEHPIFLHNENSYQKVWPMRICFFCTVEPRTGGETPIADTRRVYDRIDPEVRETFARKGWRYVRNFGTGLGLDWETVFQTSDPTQVEAYCRENGIDYEWRDDGTLRTSAWRPAVATHPITGEAVWFNHATFFHVTTLPESIRRDLEEQFDEEDLPANTYYGDGTPIEPEVVEGLRVAYEAETVRFPWRQGDLLILDNMLVAHGRSSFSGPRQILVSMSEPCGWEDLSA